MPAKKKVVEKAKSDTLKCPFCSAMMLPEDLADHVSQVHQNMNGGGTQQSQPAPRSGRTLEDVKKERGIGGPPMLHGEDLPEGVNQFQVKIRELREAPREFNSPFIIDLDEPLPVAGRAAMACNITNLRSLARLCNLDPKTCSVEQVMSAVKGRTFTLFVALTNNPKERTMVRSLFFR